MGLGQLQFLTGSLLAPGMTIYDTGREDSGLRERVWRRPKVHRRPFFGVELRHGCVRQHPLS